MFKRFALRDITLLVATVVLWVVDARRDGGSPWISIAAGIGAAVCAYSMHEWGHVIGAHLSGSVFTPARRLISPFLFSYDTTRNSRHQFVVMSLSGFAATAVYAAAYLLWMPQDRLAGRYGLNGALILAGLTVVIEFPIFFWALLGRKLPPVKLFDGPTTEDLRTDVRQSDLGADGG